MSERTFLVEYIESPEGSVAVLKNERAIARNHKFLESKNPNQGDTLSKFALGNLEAARASGYVKTQEFKMRPYTYGERLKAASRATEFGMGQFTVDQGRMNLELLAIVTERDASELEQLPNAIAQALYEEMLFLSEPDGDRLLFLLTTPTISDSGETPPKKSHFPRK